eukprot:TRINITY_DN27909_c1_g2_i1.p1 TRINITY_DN27909_c1_g2~~TRINITY_DN27909_c1_g2_i1.p1  ORF type:complete len:380 (-),score=141.88 TRINITY_DN27909_c1_g2_i1:435-1574(-)
MNARQRDLLGEELPRSSKEAPKTPLKKRAGTVAFGALPKLRDEEKLQLALPGSPPAGAQREKTVHRAASMGKLVVGDRRRMTIDMDSRSTSKRAVDLGLLRTETSKVKLQFSDAGSRAANAAAAALIGLNTVKEAPAAIPAIKAFGGEADAPAADRAAILARKHRLELFEVKHIIKKLEEAPHLPGGGVSEEAFAEVMRSVFDVPDVKYDVRRSAYLECNCAMEVSVEKFLAWYVQNMFLSVNNMNADKERANSDNLVYGLAKKFGVSAVMVDKLKQKFDKYDTDKSGMIEYDEFKAMLCVFLNAKSKGDLSDDRVKKFWKEIDKDGSATVDFNEFSEWYLKYFNNVSENDNGSSTMLVQAFYDSFNPTVQRMQQVATN